MVLIVGPEAAAFFVKVLQSALRWRLGKGKERNQSELFLVADINDTGQVQIFIAVLTNGFVIDQGNLAAPQWKKSVDPLGGGNAVKRELADHLRILDIRHVENNAATVAVGQIGSVSLDMSWSVER